MLMEKEDKKCGYLDRDWTLVCVVYSAAKDLYES